MVLACLVVLWVALVGCGSAAAPVSSGGGAAATPTPRPPYVFVAIGASETFGTGADHPATENWPMDLSSSLPRGAQVINLGIPGITAQGALQGELPEALDARPDLVTVWLGTNDIIDKVNLANYQRSLDSILAQLTASGHVRVAVANIPDLTILPRFYAFDQAALTTQVQQWNKVVAREVSAHHIILVDVYGHSSEILGHPEYLSGDGLHPSTLGYVKVANLFYQVLHANGVI
jgi:lysophospholipase L1-like esterase